ncbi:MAG TPA: alpha-N-arabinofuranosidase, partial [Bacteroidales bacterium]|nr:alpha-N-arabinofuranosidase [Bacteroidales bacterium]
MKTRILSIAFLVLCYLPSTLSQVNISLTLDQETVPMSRDLIGVFFEDINYAADGGLYAELVQNRSFEYYVVDGYTNLGPLTAWSGVQEGGASVALSVVKNHPLNQHNTNCLKLVIYNQGRAAGVKNTGFDGIALKQNENYFFSAYLKRDTDHDKAVVVQLKSSGGYIIASDTIPAIGSEWQQYHLTLKSKITFNDAALYILPQGSGNVYMDMVSLFPENTFKNRRNGLRADLAQAIADLQPRFVRFPGGCISHGKGLDNAYRWKHTVGDVAVRKPNWNLWGYHQSYGLGFYEYFLFCEDLGAKPLPVLPVGVSCQFRNREVAPLEDMGPWIQDAIDLVEFANGDTSTTWGALRAEMGHPEPFHM